MPQATNLRVKRDMDLSPVGPGTIFNTMVAISAATRDRAMLVNKTEEARLKKIERLIDKDFRSREIIQQRAIERTTKILKEKQALSHLFDKDYKVDNFITMKAGFDSDDIHTKAMARRYVVESRVFNSGFTMKAMRPEVHRRLRKMDPNQKYRVFKKKLLAENKEISGTEINRAISNSAFNRMLHDKNNWRKYNFPPKPKWLSAIESGEVEDEKGIRTAEEIQQTQTTPDGVTELQEKGVPNENDNKLRQTVLERRQARGSDAFGMTMRTLGPVYFQTSAPRAESQSQSQLEVKDG